MPFESETVIRDSGDSFELDPSRRRAVLILLRGAEIGKRYLLNERSLILGRDPLRSAIVVQDSAVSACHLRIDADPETGQYTITDLRSRNGTRVNAERIDRAVLNDGDRILIGETILKFTFHDDVESDYHAELDVLMNIDELTGLPVLRVLDVEYRKAFRASETDPLSVLMMDMDHLKQINDRHGHQTGATCVAEVGRIIGATIASAGMASRFGGDEFIAFLPSCPVGEAQRVAEAIRREVEDHPVRRGEIAVKVTISIGVAERTAEVSSPEELIRLADAALYRAKREGRNAVSL